jgi:hypothetical protein
MTTVAQMIEWMKTLPQDAEVECGAEVTNNYSTYMTMVAVDIDDCSVIDFTSDEYRVKYPKLAGKVFVLIKGE